ncbi:hypothetical protein [Streptomyces niveus]|uniref:hypothetical protein n=1 Tax=Streptomyces niveus TaxID=193462 RepID=UPI00343A53DF
MLRPEPKAYHAFLDTGDTFMVPSLNRYGRSLQDLIGIPPQWARRIAAYSSTFDIQGMTSTFRQKHPMLP